MACSASSRAPASSPADERIAPLLRAAAGRGIAVEGELDLFVQALAGLKAGRGYAPQLLAITGTNGKTTTTAMTALLVARAGRRVAVAGNIGPAMLATLAQALDREIAQDDAADAAGEAPPNETLPEVWVLELSSFQLHGVRAFEPSAAAVLNITQDHLDWHGTMDAYVADKARVFGSHGDDGASTARIRGSRNSRPPPSTRSRRAGAVNPEPRRAMSCASASMHPGIPATSAWWSRTAWPGWCVRSRPIRRSGAVPARPRRSTCST